MGQLLFEETQLKIPVFQHSLEKSHFGCKLPENDEVLGMKCNKPKAEEDATYIQNIGNINRTVFVPVFYLQHLQHDVLTSGICILLISVSASFTVGNEILCSSYRL